MKIRVGQGFDFHPFAEGRRLVLGGVEIPHPQGLDGHSDADALLHAVTDAILGAAGLADIGSHFPDTDPRYQGVSSLLLLEEAQRMVRGRGWIVNNLDVTVIAEAPRIRPHAEAIRNHLCRLLDLQPEEVGIKATTMEGKGAIGRQEGIAVLATVLLIEAPE